MALAEMSDTVKGYGRTLHSFRVREEPEIEQGPMMQVAEIEKKSKSPRFPRGRVRYAPKALKQEKNTRSPSQAGRSGCDVPCWKILHGGERENCWNEEGRIMMSLSVSESSRAVVDSAGGKVDSLFEHEELSLTEDLFLQ